MEALESRENPAVHYYGGNLLTSVEAQPVYYGSSWSSAPAVQATTDAFLKDLANSAYMDALHQAGYGVGRGTASPGVNDSINIAAGTVVTDASIQARLKSDIASGLVPAPDANRLYVVYVEPNVAVNLGNGQGTTQQGVLGYHGAFAGSNGATIRYAVIAYPGGSVGNSSLGTSAVDQLTAVTSHEVAEAVTDPDVNFGRLGWYDPQRGEIGDITENNPNALVRLDGYLVQEVANQNDQLLALSPPPVSPPPPPASNASTITTLTAGPVRYYGWYATVSLTVTVKPASGAVQPTGSVALIYNGQVLGTATLHLVNGVETATFNVTFYSNGVYSFSAQYGGDGQFAGSTSNAKSVIV
ncbi:MAG: Ig-like domain-containing protein [Gemmataceae bacterium]